MSGERVHLSLDEETANILDEMEEHINESYGGKSGFFRTMVKEYGDDEMARAHVNSINSKINKKESELEFLKKELKTWEKQLEEEQKVQQKEEVIEKIEELKAKKKNLKDDIKTEEQLRQEAKEKAKKRRKKYDWDDERVKKMKENHVSRNLNKNQDKREKIQDLEEEIEKFESMEVVENE